MRRQRRDAPEELQRAIIELRELHRSQFTATRERLISNVLASVANPQPMGSVTVGGSRGMRASLEQSLTADGQLQAASLAVIPGDAYEQRVALFGGASAEEVFDLDAIFQQNVRNVAQRHVEIEGTAHARAAGNAAAAIFEQQHGKTPRGARPFVDEGTSGGAAREAEAADLRKTGDQRFAELRAKFIKWGGRVLFERSSGGRALAKLATEETQLAKSLRGDPVNLSRAIASARASHAAKFQASLTAIKEQFVVAAEERFRFLYEAQPGTRAAPPMSRLDDDAEGAKRIDELDGLITASPEDADVVVADSVVTFVRTLQDRAGIPLGATTYRTHSWGRYSVDLFPEIDVAPDGFYDEEQVRTLFNLIDTVARDLDMEWHALYDDFDAAKATNSALKVRRVGFQWEHGPAPFVRHLHLDLMPKNLPKKKAP